MHIGVWTLAVPFCLLHAALTWRFWLRAQRLRRNVQLLAHRQSQALEMTKAFARASQRSSADVLAALAGALRERFPAIDALMVLRNAGAEFVPFFVNGARCEAFESARFPAVGAATPLTQAAACGYRVALEPPLRPLLPTDRSALAVPLDERRSAIVYVSSAGRQTIADADAIVQAVEHAAAPFAAAREREAYRQRWTYEDLTGLLTPHAFLMRLEQRVCAARIRGAHLGVWFIDVDDFKRVNDTHGHPTGDSVLQALSRVISAHVATGLDLVARHGGDEFSALLANVPKGVAIARAHRLCGSVATTGFEDATVPISVSVGVASFPVDAGSAPKLLELADAAMYHSKRCGRNRVSFAQSGSFAVFEP
jgi:diguanylate cyclase (GGDEF)-like protein